MHVSVYLLGFPSVILNYKAGRHSHILADEPNLVRILVDPKHAALRRVLAVVVLNTRSLLITRLDLSVRAGDHKIRGHDAIEVGQILARVRLDDPLPVHGLNGLDDLLLFPRLRKDRRRRHHHQQNQDSESHNANDSRGPPRRASFWAFAHDRVASINWPYERAFICSYGHLYPLAFGVYDDAGAAGRGERVC